MVLRWRLSQENDTSKDVWLFSDHDGITTWVFQVSNVPPGCHGLSCVGLVLPGPWGLETGQEMSKVKRRKAEGCGSLRDTPAHLPGAWLPPGPGVGGLRTPMLILNWGTSLGQGWEPWCTMFPRGPPALPLLGSAHITQPRLGT